MNKIVAKLRRKIKVAENLPYLLIEIDQLLSKSSLLDEEDINSLKCERALILKKIEEVHLTFDLNQSEYIYSLEEMYTVNNTDWLIRNIVPSRSLGLLYGPSGVGKTTLCIYLASLLLKNNPNVYLVYIDADMSIEKAKEMGVEEIMKTYQDRFSFACKFQDSTPHAIQSFLARIVQLQKEYPERTYVVIQDSLRLTALKKNGFIDTEKLYQNEKLLRKYGGTSLIIHHTNKKGEMADSQQIEDFADYTYQLLRNDINDVMLMRPEKNSRYDIKPKAYQLKNKVIIREIDYYKVNFSTSELYLLEFVQDLLADGEMNQGEIIDALSEVKFFSKHGIGKTKTMTKLKELSEKDYWSQKREQKNALIYFLSAEKLKNLKNCKGY